MTEEILEIIIHCGEGSFVQGKHTGICMVPFTGEAAGPWFSGNVIGTGTDTQQVRDGKITRLSARYMLEGRDHTGQSCRIFIENNGPDLEHCKPTMITDSRALASWEDADLSAQVECRQDGVIVHIFRNSF